MVFLVPESSLEGIAWPSIPERREMALLSLEFQLEQSQWWRPEEIRTYQFRQLEQLLAHARRTVPYYKKSLKKAGIKPKERISAGKWAKIPLLRRADIQAAGDNLFSNKVPPDHGKVTDIHTSGSTGKPIHALRSGVTGLFYESFILRDHLWHRRDLTRKMAAIRSHEKGVAPYPHGATGSWGVVRGGTVSTGKGVSLNIFSTVEQQVKWLKRQNPEYFLSFPSNILRLANHCLEYGIKLKNLRQVLTISEVITPALREACRKAWGVKVCDVYTTREVGCIAIQCPEHDHYHVQAEGMLVEVLDGRGKACAPGEVGRVVVTPLHNFAMPLIRYEIGDHAEVGEPCPCGRGLPVLKRILGRDQDMLVMPGGERRWTLLSSGDIGKFLDLAPIRQYQFVQKDMETIEVRLAVERGLTGEEPEAVREWVVTTFGYPFRVTLTYHDELEKEPSGKFRDFICEVKP